MESNAIVTRATVRELIQCFEQAKQAVRVHFAGLIAAQKSLDDRFKLGNHCGVSIYIERHGHRSADYLDAEYAIKEMEKQAWKSVIDRLDIWRVMSEARAKELRKLIEDGQLPELNEDNALQLAKAYVGNLDKLVDELTKEVFDWLRPRVDEEGRSYNGGQYKTNKREIIGSRVIRSCFVTPWGLGKGKFHVRYGECQQRLHTLENLFRALDGQGSTGRGFRSDLENAINESPDGEGQTEYFKFRACKNGNLHIEFRREDLLAELNRRAGGMNFKAGKKEGQKS